jgi:hypothetical protein
MLSPTTHAVRPGSPARSVEAHPPLDRSIHTVPARPPRTPPLILDLGDHHLPHRDRKRRRLDPRAPCAARPLISARILSGPTTWSVALPWRSRLAAVVGVAGPLAGIDQVVLREFDDVDIGSFMPISTSCPVS